MAIASSHLQLGDVAGWVGSIATSVALLLTYFLLRITRREQRAVQADERQAQARKVSAWCNRVDPAPSKGPDSVHVKLKNASDEPIYGVRVAVGSDWWSDPIPYKELDLSYVIAPRHDEEYSIELRLGRTAEGHPELSPPVEITFSDASGWRFWHRDRYGGIREITGEAPPSSDDYFFKPINPAAGASVRRTLSRLSRALPRPGRTQGPSAP